MTQPVKVDLPSKQISRKKHKNGTTYIYYRTNFRRNEAGKAVFDETSIGKLDETGEKLIPNQNYYKFFPDESAKYVNHVKTFGLTYTLDHLVKDLKLDEVLLPIFGSQTNDILALAFYVLAHGNVLSYAQDWMEESAWIQSVSPLTSQNISHLFANVRYDQILTFFENWTRCQSQQEYWYYDVTSISSYSQQIEAVEWGYNRDNEALPQLNVGICFGSTSNLPLFYKAYNGSITDKTYFLFLLRDFPFLDSQFPIYLVTDKGFMTRDNLQATSKKSQHFRLLSALPIASKDAQRILAQHGQSVKQDANYLIEEQVYGYCVADTVFDQPVSIYLYYDPDKASHDIKAFYEILARTEAELKAMKRTELRRKKYKSYFKIDIQNEQSFTYQRDSQAIDDYLKHCGYYMLLSTGSNLHPSQALQRYRKKDMVEKQFDQLKNELDYQRLKTHTQKTTEGKLFIGFLALILRSQMHNLIKSVPNTNKLTIKKAILELEKIKLVETNEGNHLLTPLTKKQKAILDMFNINPNDLIQAI